MRRTPDNWIRMHRMFPNYLGWRPYFACGRSQLRIGVKHYVRCEGVRPLGNADWFVRPAYHFVCLSWQ